MDIIEQIGSYAGLAAILGLAVLSALYFSQARDVKRLREWAGRAPERSETVPGVAQPAPVVAQPIRQPGQPAPPARPAGVPAGTPPVPRPPGVPQPTGGTPVPQPAKPIARPIPGVTQPTAPAQAAAAGAAPAIAKGPAAVTPAAATAAGAKPATGEEEQAEAQPADAGANGSGETAEATQVVPPADGTAPETGEGQAVEDTGDQTAVPDTGDEPAVEDTGDFPEADTGDYPGGETGEYDVESEEWAQESDEYEAVAAATPAGAASPRPTRRLFGREDAAPAVGGRPPIIPPYSQTRAQPDPWYRRIQQSPRNAVLAISAVIAMFAGAAFGVTRIVGQEEPETVSETPVVPSDEGSAPANGDAQEDAGAPAIDPASVTVAVLNGTTVGGLAKDIADRASQAGFQQGTVANNTDQTKAESVVYYAPGAEREAAAVGRELKIDQRAAITPEVQGLAGDATVVVVIGADFTP